MAMVEVNKLKEEAFLMDIRKNYFQKALEKT